MTDLLQSSLLQLRDALRNKEITSHDLVSEALLAAEDHSSLNCFTALWKESALRQAEAADRRLAAGESLRLLGVPVALKDIFTTAEGTTTCGSNMLREYRAPYDATVVQKLRAAGAVVIGKTNMDEFAMGSSSENSAFGPVRNPWDPSRVPGGSSSGSAAAVAARVVPAALGTDTGGSIRQPAAFCGITGLKPTYGRVSRYGLVAYASSLDQAGPFAQTAADCALITEVIAGHDPLDSTSALLETPKYTEGLQASVAGKRIGMPRDYFIDGLDPEVEAAVRATAETLMQLGAKIVEIDLPHTRFAAATYYVIAPAEASSNLARYDGIRYGHRTTEPESLKELYRKSRSEGFGPEVKRRILTGTYVLSRGYYDEYYLKAQKVRALIARDFQQAFENECDAILCPTTPTPAFALGEKVDDPVQMYLNDIFTIPVNLAGLPAISFPCGFSSTGLPIGAQLIGKAWDEQNILTLAAAFQSKTEWHRKTPGRAGSVPPANG